MALDAVLRVRPGERVPMDGVLTAGSTSINQAPVTGESIPVDKAVGDPVFAGTINDTGSFEFRVTALASNSTLARIIHAVEEAQGTRAPTQGFVDRFAAVYTPAVFVVALAVAVLGPWLLDWTWMQSIYKALVLLVIACPCALVISTPVTIVSGLAAAARRGILIKGGVYLEGARNLKAIALDKTGTITEGKPKLVEWKVLDTATAAGMDAATAEHMAAVLAGHSDHPVSRAIAAGLKPNSVEAKDFKAIAGRGVQAEIGGKLWVLGNHRLIEERGQCSPALEAELRTHEEAGRTVSLLASDTGPVALFAVADTIKPSSREAVAELKALGITPVMLTGDNQATATAIAHEAGIAEARGNLLPEDKLDCHQGAAGRARHDRDDRRRHQRRTRAGPVRHRCGHGCGRHRHRDGSRRRGGDERRPATHRRDGAPVEVHACGAVAEHRARPGHQGGVPGAGGVWQRLDVDGGVRRHGRQPAGGGQRAAPAEGRRAEPMRPMSPRAVAYDAALSEAERLMAAANPAAAMAMLERAHVLGQREIGPHLRVHLLMLRAAWALRDGRELRGQLLRLALTPIGHLSGRLPLGNTGASNVSPFEPMALPPELERLLRDEER